MTTLDAELAAFVAVTARAKRMAAALYRGLQERAPATTAALALARFAEDEESHAAILMDLVGEPRSSAPRAGAPPLGCGPHGESWGSGLMAAFALDQAATAALLGLAAAQHTRLAAAAQRIVDEEAQHQAFALAAFRALADADPAAGMALAREMIQDRDWIKEVYPRRTRLVELADAGLLAADAARQHDSFLASLGDRVQDALGVLGEL